MVQNVAVHSMKISDAMAAPDLSSLTCTAMVNAAA
jgi:hypothetical protein